MEKGKIIVIEGTDCSGKETQSKLLIENLKKDGIEAEYMCYPRYDTPTGKIVGWPYLGKSYIPDEMIDNALLKVLEKKDIKLTPDNISLISEVIDEIKTEISGCWFKNGANSVDPKVASLYYAADRRAHQEEVEYILNQGINVILDRYVYSNLAHQGGKVKDDNQRKQIYKWNEELEFGLLELLPADFKLFLHMPTVYANLIKTRREEKLDEHEKNPEHLYNAEKAYLEVAQMYDFYTIECARKTDKVASLSDIKSREEIACEVYSLVKRNLRLR